MTELDVFNELQKLGFKSGDRLVFDGNILSFQRIEEEPPVISFYNCDFTKGQLDEIQKNPDVLLDHVAASAQEDPEAWREEYRKKQAAGVMYECLRCSGKWEFGKHLFNSEKERYREVPQEPATHNSVSEYNSSQWWCKELESIWCAPLGSAITMDMKRAAKVAIDLMKLVDATQSEVTQQPEDAIPQPVIPHVKERALYWAQRAAGTNEVWQVRERDNTWTDRAFEPSWHPTFTYRVKPKTVTYYFALMSSSMRCPLAICFMEKEPIMSYAKNNGLTIIGGIEEREVSIE